MSPSHKSLPNRTTNREASRLLTYFVWGPLLKLKYHDAIADAVADLGRPEEIGHLFAGFQQCLYRTEQM